MAKKLTRTKKNNLLLAIQSKAAKLYLDGLFSMKDYDAIVRIVQRNISRNK